MNKPYKYKAFISYSHKDKAFASWLQRGIENYKIPRALRQKYPHLPKDLKRTVFRDEEELAGANALTPVLEDALRTSQNFIVVCSAHAVKSTWVDKEIAYFTEVHEDAPIISVIKEGEAKDVLPQCLVADYVEPLAIDVNNGRKKALMKVIATLLGVEFSDIWEREKREARKRVMFAGLVLGVVLILGIYAFMQYTAISSNQELEQINREISTIEYKLKRSDLNQDEVYRLGKNLKALKDAKKLKVDTLKWFGLLQTSVSQKAKKLYDKEGVDAALALLESSKSVAEDENYAKKNMLRAKLYIEKNDYEEATRYYEKAVAIDGSYENVYDYVLFLMKEKQMPRSRVLLEKLRWDDLTREQKANVFNRLGIVYRNVKRYDEAKEMYEKALALRKALAKENPDKYNLDLAWTYNNLGVLYKKLNLIKEAERMHYKAFSLRKGLVEKNANKYTFYVTCSMHNLGELYSGMHETDKAKKFFESSIKIRRELLSTQSKKYLPALATSLHDLATLYAEANDTIVAKKLYKEALSYRTTLAKENPQAYSSDLNETQKALEKLMRKRL
jgi:tetratricopeptide (TPR) repeat protein